MLQVVLYFVLNFAGFFVFLAVWNYLPKPKPFDYTTIPGLKLNVASADEIPELVKRPGERVDPDFRGHLLEIRKHSDLREFLRFMFLTYGPLSSFWWSTRYVAVVSSETFVAELKKFRTSLVAISPFCIGSYLHGAAKYSNSVEYGALNIQKLPPPDVDAKLTETAQNTCFMELEAETEGAEEVADRSEIIEILRQSGPQYRQEKKLRKSLGRPLLVVFDQEIWVDAHPIPKYIPIIIHTEEIIREWTDDELFPKFYAQFYWLPGFSNLNDIL